MRTGDENLITCTNGHTTARKRWRLLDVDPAYRCCPICGELHDAAVPEIAQPDQPPPIPVGRHSIHVVSLIRKVEAWDRSRRAGGFGGGCLPEVVKYLGEYRDLLAASDVELATGYDLDRLLDPLPRQSAETDEDYRARAMRAPVAEHCAITVSHAVRTLPTFQNQPVPVVVTREGVERAEKIADENRSIGTVRMKDHQTWLAESPDLALKICEACGKPAKTLRRFIDRMLGECCLNLPIDKLYPR